MLRAMKPAALVRLPLLRALFSAVALVACSTGTAPVTERVPAGDAAGGRGAESSGPAADARRTAEADDGTGPETDARPVAPDAAAGRTEADARATPPDAGRPSAPADAAGPPSPPPDDRPWRVIGYYPSWGTYERNVQVADLDAARLTHVNYAFARVDENGGCALADPWADVEQAFAADTPEDAAAGRAGNFGALRRLRAAHPHLRTLISVGGWGGSEGLSDAASTADRRRAFAASCARFVETHGFDGLDLDWEFPVSGGTASARPADRENFPRLLAALRSALDELAARTGHAPYLLTIATPAMAATHPGFDLPALAAQVDWINVMTYDFTGPWDTRTGHNAPLHAPGDAPAEASAANPSANVAAALDEHRAAGVAAERLVMGVPFYGRSFAGVPGGGHQGLYQPFEGLGPGSYDPGFVEFRRLDELRLRPGMVEYRHAVASVPWLYSQEEDLFVTYDDPESLAAKRDLARARGLGGVMAWDLSHDTADHALLRAIQAPTGP
jgi:chitinase